MIQIQKNNQDIEWTDLPLPILLYKWAAKNNDGTTFGYFILAIIVWYVMTTWISWTIRLIMKIIWPLFVVASAVLIYHVLKSCDAEDILNFVANSFILIADVVVMVLANTLNLVLKFFEYLTDDKETNSNYG